MVKQLMKTGNSEALIISKEMRAHLNLIDNKIDVQYEKGRIVLSSPDPEVAERRSFEQALQETTQQFDTALRNLAK